MGFHKRHISNNQINQLLKEKNFNGILSLFEGTVDVYSVEKGVSSEVYDIVTENAMYNREIILNLIKNHLMNI